MTQPVALITGCSSGIGRALADAFQAAGYCVWASARKAEDLAALSAAGFTAVQLDVNDGLALGQLAERLKAEAGGLDVLINNAGLLQPVAPLGAQGAAAIAQALSCDRAACAAYGRSFSWERSAQEFLSGLHAIDPLLIDSAA